MAIDACLSHGLKRRALGLFKTNSSTALIQKVAKNYRVAQDILGMVSDEEKRILDEQQQQVNNARKQSLINTNLQQQQNQDSDHNKQNNLNQNKSPIKQQASNTNVYRRNLWIKCALIEKKLVNIVEYLAENANKYYESDALMANYLCAQILSSLLVGPSALEFSKSKTNDYYEYNDPTADELITRHKLANPIACLCSNSARRSSNHHQELSVANHHKQEPSHITSRNPVKFSKSTDPPATKTEHMKLANTQNSLNILSTINGSNQAANNCSLIREQSPSNDNIEQRKTNKSVASNNTTTTTTNNRKDNRRKPLALKTTNIKRGTLLTDCHHYSCQEISEHNPTRGYSFLSTSSNGLTATNSLIVTNSNCNTNCQSNNGANSSSNHVCQMQDWSAWSPRMLHETLHQNSKSSLLYAKNNVLLETQPNETMAGYLSLHETSTDLILKWIPNQMINGGQVVNSSNSCHQPVNKLDPENNKIDGIETIMATTSGHNSSHKRMNEHSMAVESSYLDLVVCLSVSQIVLLHCRFLTHKQNFDTKCENINEKQQDDKSIQEELLSTEVDETNSSSYQSQNHGNTHETLILIEADGVQRSPFIFPKGGLRVFLSCLENGLRPNKYLDPAIKFDDEGAFDPLEPEIGVEGNSFPKENTLESPGSTSSMSESFAVSKFDSFLKRLPSLKRIRENKQVACNDDVQSSNCSCTIEQTKPNNISTNLNNENLDHSEQTKQNDFTHSTKTTTTTKLTQTNHYVYRIVSIQQPDWPLQTPPHSALSVGSSPSGSFRLNDNQQVNNQTSGQKFRWSLSRLAKFSSKYAQQQNGSTSSSTGPTNNNTSRRSVSIGINSTSTINGSLGSLLSFYQSSINNLTTENTSIQSDNLLLDDSISQPLDVLPTNTDKISTQQQKEEGESREIDDESNDLVRIEAKLNDLKKSTSDDVIQALRTQSIQTLCESMRKQIVARAFYGWLVYCRKAKIIRTHLIHLIKDDGNCLLINDYGIDQIEPSNERIGDSICVFEQGLTRDTWQQLMKKKDSMGESDLCNKVNQFVYYGGIESDELRREVWPYLLEHYKFKDNEEQRKVRDQLVREAYKSCEQDWIKIERVVKRRDSELLAANMAKVSRDKKLAEQINMKQSGVELDNEDNISVNLEKKSSEETETITATTTGNLFRENRLDSLQELPDTESTHCDSDEIVEQLSDKEQEQLIVDNSNGGTNQNKQQQQQSNSKLTKKQATDSKSKRKKRRRRHRLESTGSVGSDASITDQFGNNIHRIDKDVQRCDRNFWYFKETKNLDKLRNIMCSYVWQHLDVGYVQGMCDLAAPFLVIFDDEIMAFSCFNQLMKRMVANFPHGCAMDQHFESLKYLMQVIDPKLYEILQSNGDYTHFYFCYRWLLLDFKRGKLDYIIQFQIKLFSRL